MSSELRLPHVRISSHLGEYPDVEVDGVLLNGVTEFEFKPPRRDSAVHRYASHVGGTESFVGETLADTLRKARKSGWEITEKKVLCPACAGSTKKG